MDGCIVEDSAWLMNKTDFSHIILAELKALLKGFNLAVKWGLEKKYICSNRFVNST